MRGGASLDARCMWRVGGGREGANSVYKEIEMDARGTKRNTRRPDPTTERNASANASIKCIVYQRTMKCV